VRGLEAAHQEGDRIMNDYPIVLRAEDLAAPADPQATLIELAAQAALLTGELAILRDRMARWSADPSSVCRVAQPRLVELHEQAGRIQDLLQTLSQGYRAAGCYAGRGSGGLE
jgi:hypothetical protein